MGFDIIDFDEYAYRRKLKSMSPSQLATEQQSQVPNDHGALASVKMSTKMLVQTAGVSVFGIAIGARRKWLAERKLELARAEADSRGQEQYKERTRDAFIGVGRSMLTCGIGHGADVLVVEAAGHVLSSGALDADADHGTQALGDALVGPHDFAHGIHEGLAMHAVEVVGLEHGFHAAAEHAHAEDLIIFSESANLGSSEVSGMAMGEALALACEKQFASWGAENVAGMLVDTSTREKLQAVTYMKPNSCTYEPSEVSNLGCSACKSIIVPGFDKYYHCCLCDSDTFNLCEDCVVKKEKGCRNRTNHVLYSLGSTCRKFVNGHWQSGYTRIGCYWCEADISQMSYYHCCQCACDDFNICANCFHQGEKCHNNSHGTLMWIPGK